MERFEPYTLGIVKSLSGLQCKIDLERFRGRTDFEIDGDTIYTINLVRDLDVEKQIWLTNYATGRHAGKLVIPWSYEGLVFVRKVVETTQSVTIPNRWVSVVRPPEEMHTFAEGDVIAHNGALYRVSGMNSNGFVAAEAYEAANRRINLGVSSARGYVGFFAPKHAY